MQRKSLSEHLSVTINTFPAVTRVDRDRGFDATRTQYRHTQNTKVLIYDVPVSGQRFRWRMPLVKSFSSLYDLVVPKREHTEADQMSQKGEVCFSARIELRPDTWTPIDCLRGFYSTGILETHGVGGLSTKAL